MNKKGYIHVYTGNGKGKTTAALGLVFRAIGYDYKVYFTQFIKNVISGDILSLRKFPQLVTICSDVNVNRKIPIHKPNEFEINEAKVNTYIFLKQALDNMLSLKYDIIVLDEILVAIDLKYISLQQVLYFIDKKPKKVELILTGRNCPDKIIEIADLVTEMKEVKHYYNQGVLARKGIEY